MIAVFKHELRSYFHSLTAYVFGAFLLAFVGIWAMQYNLQSAVSNFEYVLGDSSLIFAVLVPILTMRVIAEERKQKTDQLLYALPISTVEVVLGKYLALLVLLLIPLAVISLYPLLFAQFGDVYLPTSYGSLLAFFLLGAALIAVGVFISCLTENQGMAAGIGVAAMLLNYFSVSLSEYVSATALGSVSGHHRNLCPSGGPLWTITEKPCGSCGPGRKTTPVRPSSAPPCLAAVRRSSHCTTDIWVCDTGRYGTGASAFSSFCLLPSGAAFL